VLKIIKIDFYYSLICTFITVFLRTLVPAMPKKIKIPILTVMYLFGFFTQILSQQNRSIDSLKFALKNAKHDSIRANIYLAWGESIQLEKPDSSEILWTRAKKILEVLIKDRPKGVRRTVKRNYAGVLNNLGYRYLQQGKINEALDHYTRSSDILEEIDDKESLPALIINIGYIYENQGNVTKAMASYRKSLSLLESSPLKKDIKNKSVEASCLNNISILYFRLNDYSNALDYQKKSLKIREEINDKKNIAYSLNNIGQMYLKAGDIEKTRNFYDRSLQVAREINDQAMIAAVSMNLGYIYQTHGMEFNGKPDLSKALQYYNNSLAIQRQILDIKGEANTLNNIAGICFQKKNYGEAIKFARTSLNLALELGFPENIKNASEMLFKIYKETKDFKKSFQMLELSVQMRDSVNNIQTKKAAIKSQLKYEYEKQAAKDSIRNAEKIVQENIKYEVAIKQQRLYSYGGVIGFGLMLVIAGVSFRAYRNKQKANEIISEQKKLVEKQKHLVEEKQKEILDSIHYAKRIQNALVTNEKYIEKKLRGSK
jgi:tetratricopeptide (TPR) repeat protein